MHCGFGYHFFHMTNGRYAPIADKQLSNSAKNFKYESGLEWSYVNEWHSSTAGDVPRVTPTRQLAGRNAEYLPEPAFRKRRIDVSWREKCSLVDVFRQLSVC